MKCYTLNSKKKFKNGIFDSKSNEDPSYINENKISGHGKPITFKQLKDMLEKGENSMVKIKYIGVKGTGFFLNKIFHQ